MTQEQFVSRKERAERDVFVITAAEEGWRVRSAHNPSKYYLVSANGTELQCACPDFQGHAPQDPTWRCKHVLAVQDYQAKTGAGDPQTERELAEERAAVQAEGSGEVQRPNGEPSAAQMLIKRSISPDGRIDSISIEFAFTLSEVTVSQIRDRAAKTPRILSGPGPVPFGVGLVLLAGLPQDPVVIRIVRRDGPDTRDRQAASGSRLSVGSGGGGTACRRKTAISFGPAAG